MCDNFISPVPSVCVCDGVKDGPSISISLATLVVSLDEVVSQDGLCEVDLSLDHS